MRAMRISVLCLLAGLGTMAAGQERETLGTARLFTNDYFGDGQDRWRSGGYHLGLIRGPGWGGARPDEFGAILEYRFRTEIIAPDHGTRDRPYAGTLSFGIHAHSVLGPFDLSVGADVLAVGPQTRVSDFQEAYHEVFSLPRPPGVADQIPDAVHLAGTAELALPVRVSDRMTLRPFVELQGGAEDLIRVGADVVLGPVGQADLLVRDNVTGHLMRGVEGDALGWGLVAGADWTQVDGSIYLEEAMIEESRVRARLGVHWQIASEISVFYGASWHSEEFRGQEEAQILGAVKLNFNF